MMPQKDSTKIPPPCPDCNGYHSDEDQEAFEKGQAAFKAQMSEIMEGPGKVLTELQTRLQLATTDQFEQSVIVGFFVHWLLKDKEVPLVVIDRIMDTLVDSIEPDPVLTEMYEQFRGKKPGAA